MTSPSCQRRHGRPVGRQGRGRDPRPRPDRQDPRRHGHSAPRGIRGGEGNGRQGARGKRGAEEADRRIAGETRRPVSVRVGVEVGGTFTDLVAVEGGRVIVTKVPSTPRSPDIGAFNALTESGIDLSRIEDLGHGSTVATNAVLERKGASVAFIATQGFRDLLFMQRHDRRNIYDLFYGKPAPPVRRKDCFEATERLKADGSIDKALDEAAVRNVLIPALKAGGYRAVAICLLNAYANPAHEQRLAALIAEA